MLRIIFASQMNNIKAPLPAVQYAVAVSEPVVPAFAGILNKRIWQKTRIL